LVLRRGVGISKWFSCGGAGARRGCAQEMEKWQRVAPPNWRRLTSNGLRPQASDWEPTPRKAGPRAKFQTTKSDRLLVENNTSNSKNSSTAPETALRA
jgi:hypothetical protein